MANLSASAERSGRVPPACPLRGVNDGQSRGRAVTKPSRSLRLSAEPNADCADLVTVPTLVHGLLPRLEIPCTGDRHNPAHVPRPHGRASQDRRCQVAPVARSSGRGDLSKTLNHARVRRRAATRRLTGQPEPSTAYCRRRTHAGARLRSQIVPTSPARKSLFR